MDGVTLDVDQGGSAATSYPTSVRRFVNTLAELAVTGRPREIPDGAHTAKAAAEGLGVAVGQIASSLVFFADATPVLVIASGGHRVDVAQLGAILEAGHVRMATPQQVRDLTGFSIGGVSPVGHRIPLRTVVDIDLAHFDVVWAAAGHPHWVFPTHYDELLRITAGTAAEVGG